MRIWEAMVKLRHSIQVMELFNGDSADFLHKFYQTRFIESFRPFELVPKY